ncbi:aldo/keto reductase [Sulfitobacter sabulilitoris]|uniref:Aldo/keto reductase n=1 Tax=Sulfitobacter sabulilitoris TaxID=2562655 RepID=A0A5S3PCR9_9RHOB|nr:aldo/keto reductase [Sulfitobacter sabulilitoris]TMM51548.1 aldo/keto reductase [Sulfitobacter sabulilitoris]
MKQRKLGAGGPSVSAIGLGCMSFAGAFGETDEATSLRCLDAAHDGGITFYDTANVYGMGRSENVLGAWLASRKPDVTIATKGGIVRDPNRRANNEANHLRRELEGSLKRLGVDHVGLYYIHRRDQTVPLEDVIGTLSDFVAEGKIGGYGLSEVAPQTVRLAHAIHPCTAVQSEYSLWTRLPELGMIQTCADLGVAFVPFSPLARGVFGQGYPDTTSMAPGDFRLPIPRFSDRNYPRNKAIIDRFKSYAADRGQAVAELAMAWVLNRGDHLIPIPGTRTAAHLAEWINADAVALPPEDMAEIERLLPVGFAHGDRYSDTQMQSVERYC